MARSDLLVTLVRAGLKGEQDLFRRTVEAVIAEENSKQHRVLANELSDQLKSASVTSINSRAVGGSNGSSPQLFYDRSPLKELSDLVLSEAVRKVVCEFIEEQHRADLLRSYNLEPRNRLLLIGPPGNGKTSLAEACANALAVPFLTVRYDALIGSYLGETAVRVRQLFDLVRKQRCVLFFDEFDAIAKERGDIHETGEIKRVVSSLLLEIDRLPSYVTVLTATNHAELLDRAVWRRFQIKLYLGRPDKRQIVDWLGQFEGRTSIRIGSKGIAERLEGVSFSELEDIALDVARRSVLSPDVRKDKIVAGALRYWAESVRGRQRSMK
ncbi:MAG: family ATPase [Acidobacteriaceae bacterium]|jgi:AAA+ superfamily predicted ATPase|nr:family ATPase [Acidobacteriaceae bacterium]